MKSILFGLALLCALPGCCGMMDCKKDKCEKPAKKEKKRCGEKCDKGNAGRKEAKKDMNYKK